MSVGMASLWRRFMVWLGVREVAFPRGGSSGDLPVVNDDSVGRVKAVRAVVEAREERELLKKRIAACQDALATLDDDVMNASRRPVVSGALGVVDTNISMLRKRRLTAVLGWSEPKETFKAQYDILMDRLLNEQEALIMLKSRGVLLSRTVAARPDERGMQMVPGANVTALVAIVNEAKKDLRAIIGALEQREEAAAERELQADALARLR